MKSVIASGVSSWARVFVTLPGSTAAFSSPAAGTEPELLEPEKAFRISTRALGKNSVEVRFANVPFEQFVEMRLPVAPSPPSASTSQRGPR